jgi:hypothetical protein
METQMAANYGPPPVRGPAHERLGVFVGRWHAEGMSYGGPDQDPEAPRARGVPWISGELTEWHPGGFFIVQDEDATIGSQSLITHAMIGWNAGAGHYVAHAIENHGFYRRHIVRNHGAIWTFTASTERATVEFSDDGERQSVLWEWRPSGETWLPLCERTNVRVDQALTLSKRPA